MRALAAVLLIAAAPAWAQWTPELTAEAKASPAADRWLTLDDNVLTGGVRRGGALIEGDLRAFADVPASLPAAQKGQGYQMAMRAELFGGSALMSSGLSVIFVTIAVPALTALPWVGFALAALGTVGELLGLFHRRIAHDAFLEAVQRHNTAVNDGLPDDQRLELGAFGVNQLP